MACSDNSDESVADIIGSEGATTVANTIAESGFDAKNDEIGDAGNRKGDSLVCYTLWAMINFDVISTDYFDRVDNALTVIGTSATSSDEKDIRESSKDLLAAWKEVIANGWLGVEATFGPTEILTNSCIENKSEDFFAPFNK
jgi:hypothetical protein